MRREGGIADLDRVRARRQVERAKRRADAATPAIDQHFAPRRDGEFEPRSACRQRLVAFFGQLSRGRVGRDACDRGGRRRKSGTRGRLCLARHRRGGRRARARPPPPPPPPPPPKKKHTRPPPPGGAPPRGRKPPPRPPAPAPPR